MDAGTNKLFPEAVTRDQRDHWTIEFAGLLEHDQIVCDCAKQNAHSLWDRSFLKLWAPDDDDELKALCQLFSDQIQRIGVIPYTNKMTLGSQCVSLTCIAKQLGECARMPL